MILTRDTHHGDYEIRSYEPGSIKINETIYTQSVLVSSNKLELWAPQCFEEITSSNIQSILALKPDIVLLGTGSQSSFLTSNLLEVFFQNNIGIETMNTLSACHTFNVLMSEGRNAVAALIIR